MLIALRGHRHANLVRRPRNRMPESASRTAVSWSSRHSLAFNIRHFCSLLHLGASSFLAESYILYADRVPQPLPCISANLCQYLMMFGECGNSLSPPAPLYRLYRLYTLYTPEISHFDLDSSWKFDIICWSCYAATTTQVSFVEPPGEKSVVLEALSCIR